MNEKIVIMLMKVMIIPILINTATNNIGNSKNPQPGFSGCFD